LVKIEKKTEKNYILTVAQEIGSVHVVTVAVSDLNWFQ